MTGHGDVIGSAGGHEVKGHARDIETTAILNCLGAYRVTHVDILRTCEGVLAYRNWFNGPLNVSGTWAHATLLLFKALLHVTSIIKLQGEEL